MTGERVRIEVVAAIVERDGCFLLTRRLAGTHLAGSWEFPGGKCELDEGHAACLRRELREELGTDADIGDLVLSTEHAYPERLVRLHFYRAVLHGEPAPLLGQEMRWARRSQLPALEFPEGDRELIELLARSVGAAPPHAPR